jgi:hypothetical protein
MVCHQCGRRNDTTANFCTGCGTRLHPDPQTATRGHPVVELPQRDPSADRPARPTHPALVVRRGPNVGSRYPLTPGITTVGRDGAATILLNDISVSRRHATIENDGGRCAVVDENSLNGTYLNGRRIDPRSRLSHGDELQIGRFRIVYLEPEREMETAAIR